MVLCAESPLLLLEGKGRGKGNRTDRFRVEAVFFPATKHFRGLSSPGFRREQASHAQEQLSRLQLLFFCILCPGIHDCGAEGTLCWEIGW